MFAFPLFILDSYLAFMGNFLNMRTPVYLFVDKQRTHHTAHGKHEKINSTFWITIFLRLHSPLFLPAINKIDSSIATAIFFKSLFQRKFQKFGATMIWKNHRNGYMTSNDYKWL